MSLDHLNVKPHSPKISTAHRISKNYPMQYAQGNMLKITQHTIGHIMRLLKTQHPALTGQKGVNQRHHIKREQRSKGHPPHNNPANLLS